MIQANSGFNYGYGNNPNDPSRSAGFIGDTPFGPGFGYSFGNSALNAASTGFNTINGLGMMAGLASGFGIGGPGLATFGRVAGGLGFGGMIMPMLAPMAISHALGGMAHGAQQQMGVHNIMNQMAGQRNMGGFGGVGFNARSAQMMTETIRELAAVPEMMTNQGELTNILKGLSNMKLMQSVKSAKEMSSKFSSIVTTMRDMAKELNTTLENVMPYIEQFNNQGFFHLNDIRRGSVQTHTTAGVGIGMNEQNLVQLQGVGSDMVKNYGGRRRIGSEGMRSMAGQLSVGVSRGLIKEEDIHEITGKRGEEGVGEMSKRLMDINVKLMESQGFGDMLTAVLGKQDAEGQFTGELDEKLLEDLQAGRLSKSRMEELFTQKMSKGKAQVTFMTRKARGMGAEFATKLGPSGTKKAIDALINDKDMSDEEKKLVIKNVVNEEMALIDAMFKLNEQSDKMSTFLETEMESVAKRNRMMSALKLRSIGAKYQRFKTNLGHYMTTPFEEAGSAFITHFGEVGDLMSHDIANGNFATAFARGVGGLVGIQPTAVRGSVADVREDVVGRLLLGDRESVGESEDESLKKALASQGLSWFGEDTEASSKDKRTNGDPSDVFSELRSGKTSEAQYKKFENDTYTKELNLLIKQKLQDAASQGLKGSEAIAYLRKKVAKKFLNVGAGLDAHLYELENKASTDTEKSFYREARDSQYQSMVLQASMGGSMGMKDITKFRAESFDNTDTYTGKWDWNLTNSKLNKLDSTILMDTFGAKSSVSLNKQAEISKLLRMIMTNDGFGKDFIFTANQKSKTEINAWLENKGIKLTVEDMGSPLFDEMLDIANEYAGLSDSKKSAATDFAKNLEKIVKSDLKGQTKSGLSSLNKFLLGQDASSGPLKELREFVDTSDITNLDELVDSVTTESLSRFKDGSKEKELMSEILTNKEAYAKLDDKQKRDFIESKLGKENVKSSLDKGVTLETLAKRAQGAPVLREIKPEGAASIDEQVMIAAGYSKEVAEAMTEMSGTLAGYMKEQRSAISATQEYVNVSKDAIVTVSNVVKAGNSP